MILRKFSIFIAVIYTLTLLSAPQGQAEAAATEKSAAEKHWEQTLKEGVDALDTNKYWIAEPALKNAAVEAATFGAEDLRLAKSYAELGRLYVVRGRFEEAEPLLEEELFIKRQRLEEEGEQLVPAMGAMIRFYLNYGSKSKADALTAEMLEIVEGKLREPGGNSSTKTTMENGKKVYEMWAGVAADAQVNPFIEWAIACDSVANVYLAQENYQSAERLFKAALEVKETVLGKNHLSLANSYDSLGKLALSRKDYFTAESHLKDAYQMSSKILTNSSSVVYWRLDKLAKCLILEGKRQEAEQLYLTAESFWKDSKIKTSEPISACFALGNLYCEDKNYNAAEPWLKKAMEKSQEYYGECSESLLPYIQRYAYVLYYLNRKAESDVLKAKAADISGAGMIAEKDFSTKPSAPLRL